MTLIICSSQWFSETPGWTISNSGSPEKGWSNQEARAYHGNITKEGPILISANVTSWKTSAKQAMKLKADILALQEVKINSKRKEGAKKMCEKYGNKYSSEN